MNETGIRRDPMSFRYSSPLEMLCLAAVKMQPAKIPIALINGL
jgi:hypothetical protein